METTMGSFKDEPSFAASPNTSKADVGRKHTSLPGVTIDPRFLYEMNFKGKVVLDLKAEGYIDAIWKYLRGLETEIIHYGRLDEGRSIFCVVRARIRISMDGHTIEATALADGHSGEVEEDQLVRHVETRAIKRAAARVGNLSRVHFNSEEFDEEESGTPIRREVYSSGSPRKDAPTPAIASRRRGGSPEEPEPPAPETQDAPPVVARRNRGG